ncbi:unnamed protein product [Linum trigynum]|uniref:Tf2-1-like SH3-like domain-containing protein n=1 Tax=Linum trigynum TaxID=586398 RepID=A0AAV2EAE3_9ROSI
MSPFQVVYELLPRGPLDLLSLPSKVRNHATAAEFVEQLSHVHRTTHDRLVASTAAYKVAADRHRCAVDFKVGDFVWAILTKDRFPARDYSMLASKKLGPVEIVEKINPNAYRLRLPGHVRTSDVFNVKHLIPFSEESSSDEDNGGTDSRANLFDPGENDGDVEDVHN